MSEARDEAARRWRLWLPTGDDEIDRDGYDEQAAAWQNPASEMQRGAFVEGAEWQAARTADRLDESGILHLAHAAGIDSTSIEIEIAILAYKLLYARWVVMTDKAARETAKRVELAAEVERLSRWKHESLPILAGWDGVWTAAGRPGPLGTTKAVGVREELDRREQRAEAAEAKLAEVRDALANPDIPYDDERCDAIRAALDETEATT